MRAHSHEASWARKTANAQTAVILSRNADSTCRDNANRAQKLPVALYDMDFRWPLGIYPPPKSFRIARRRFFSSFRGGKYLECSCIKAK